MKNVSGAPRVRAMLFLIVFLCAPAWSFASENSSRREKEYMGRLWLGSKHPHRPDGEPKLNQENPGVGLRKYIPAERGSWFGERRFFEADVIFRNSYEGRLYTIGWGIEHKIAIVGDFDFFAGLALVAGRYENAVEKKSYTGLGPIPALSLGYFDWRFDTTLVPKNGHRLRAVAFSVSRLF